MELDLFGVEARLFQILLKRRFRPYIPSGISNISADIPTHLAAMMLATEPFLRKECAWFLGVPLVSVDTQHERPLAVMGDAAAEGKESTVQGQAGLSAREGGGNASGSSHSLPFP